MLNKEKTTLTNQQSEGVSTSAKLNYQASERVMTLDLKNHASRPGLKFAICYGYTIYTIAFLMGGVVELEVHYSWLS